jgi:hypothetical protein
MYWKDCLEEFLAPDLKSFSKRSETPYTNKNETHWIRCCSILLKRGGASNQPRRFLYMRPVS